MNSKSEFVGIVITILFVLLIIFLQPVLVDTKSTIPPNKLDNHHCNHKGLINIDGQCECYSGWYGAHCTLSA